MKKTFLPIFTSPSVIQKRRTIFHRMDEKVVVEVPGRLIRQLIEICDGTRFFEEIVRLLKSEWDDRSVRNLIKRLCQHNILVDSRYLSNIAWRTVENPSRFLSSITDDEVGKLIERAAERHRGQPSNKAYQVSPSLFRGLLNHRSSGRFFSGESIELQSIIDMLWSAYGEVQTPKNDGILTTNYRRTVPSAGALYPLMIHVALFKDAGELHPGVYRAWMGLPGMVGFNLVSWNTDGFVRSFVDPFVLNESHGVIIVSGSFHATGKKYGNRSMLYVTLEAGHVAQNIHLAASESRVATVEIGGFYEELVAESIGLPTHFHPLTTVVFGHKGKGSHEDSLKQKIEVAWAIPMAGQYRLPFSMAFAKMFSAKNDDDWSCGRSVSPQLAQTKAVAEAKEWSACGCISDELVQARLSDLETAIDPRTIIKFHQAQYRLNGFLFEPFNENLKYDWVEGKDEMRGVNVHVLADCVYYPYSSSAPRYAHASSSGVAAHPEKQQAIKNGTLELVERDSFMIAYLAKLILPTITEKTLPQGIQERIHNLRKSGFKVWVKDYSLDLAPVLFIFAQNKELAFTTCAGCAHFDTEEALDHALMEIESSVLCRLANGPSKAIQPSMVHFPKDHGRLYEQRRFFRKADFLVRGRESIPFQEVGQGVARSWQDLFDRFVEKGWSLITIHLYLTAEFGGNDGLHIIRSIVPGMIPISFGYQEIPCGMERIRVVAEKIKGVPVLYRDMSKFPHPYT